jgi:hypothetical protein
MAEELKEYIVSVEDKSQLDSLYEKMESSGGSEFVPDRKVDVAHRRPMSRNTHYMLTESEAQSLINEEGIINVEIAPSEIGAKPRPHWIQRSSNWDRCGNQNGNDVNWGLLRSSLDKNILNWGASFCSPGDREIISSSDGLNVDVVISDGMVNPAHPEMALNQNGTGGTRVIQYNWLQHRQQVQGVANGTYVYTPYNDTSNADRTADNNHGMHVAGTVAGNRQGWAKRANIYNINPYSTDVNAVADLFHFDYIRAFHKAKLVNPVTKVINPTVVNASWGYSSSLPITQINRIVFRGTTINGPFTASLATFDSLFRNYNISSDEISDVILAYRYNALDIDIQDAINDGIIIISSAGNATTRIDINGGAEWNDAVVSASNQTYNYHRGESPSSSSTVICVGAIDEYSDSVEMKAWYSNYGPRIDVWSPGSSIISSVHTGGITDPRNSSFRLDKYSGTSMASPQVCGIIACLMQKYPRLRQADVLKFLKEKLSINNRVTDDPSDVYKTLQGSVTRYLYNYPHKRSTDRTVPDHNYMLRENSSVKYPRLKINRKI